MVKNRASEAPSRRALWFIAAAAGITLVSTAGVCLYLSVKGTGTGYAAYHYFTVLSNILSALCGIPPLRAAVRGLRTGEFCPSPAASVLRFVGCTAVSVTFLTVIFFLAPLYHFMPSLFVGVNFWLHLVNPILAVLSFCFAEAARPVPVRFLPLGALPTVLYGAVYCPMVLTGRWDDFYGFIGGRWILSAAVMTAASLLIAWGLLLVRNRRSGKRREGA